MLSLVEHLLRDEGRGHRRRPTSIKGEMGDHLAELVFAQTVVERPPQMTDELPFAAERDQGRAGDQAAVAFGKTGAFPDLAEQDPRAEIDQAGNDVADLLASRRGLRLSHGFLLFRSSGWMRREASTRLPRRARRNVTRAALLRLRRCSASFGARGFDLPRRSELLPVETRPRPRGIAR